jgi:hypothetical protein
MKDTKNIKTSCLMNASCCLSKIVIYNKTPSQSNGVLT